MNSVVIDSRAASAEPKFSVIVALHNAAETLPATLMSFEAQTLPQEELEFLIVNDGSEDESLEIAVLWAKQQKNVVIVDKPNGGIASARNAALEHARGEWITSVDPDDLVEPRYFEEVHKALLHDIQDEVALVSTRVMVLEHDSGRFHVNHPLDPKFRKGNRVVDLRTEPNAFAIGATSFVRRAVLLEHGIVFDEKVLPSFEDGNLLLRYLCHFEAPIVALVASAHYYYRKVANGNSAVQSGWSKPEKYVDQVEWGYLGAIRHAVQILERVPDWMALAICYDLMYYFKEYHKFGSKTRWVSEDTRVRFMQLCREIFAFFTVDQLKLLGVNGPNWSMLQALRVGFLLDGAPARLYRWGKNRDGSLNYSVIYRPDAGELQLFSRGVPVAVTPAGVKQHEYYGEVLAVEASVTLPAGDAALFCGGRPCPLGQGPDPQRQLAVSPHAKRLAELTRAIRGSAFDWDRKARMRERLWVESRVLGKSTLAVVAGKARRRLRRSHAPQPTADQALVASVEAVRSSEAGQAYRNCWFFIDHPDRADDNAEHLYRHVMREHPQLRAVFALERSSRDWSRLEAEGFDLIEYGSPECMAAALEASVVLSSDAVESCMYPAPRRLFGKPRARFVFLQHGITMNDISTWLRGKAIALCVCATIDEYRAFSWKDSPYEFQSSRLALTGFPRHDALLLKAQERARSEEEGAPKRLLIIPTWRRDLKLELDGAESPEEAQKIFADSLFGRSWMGLLRSPAVQAEVARGRLRIDFLLHPNFAAGVAKNEAVDGVRFLEVGDRSFQEMMVDCDFFVTDYSSLAFDVSYIERPVAYFQFDADAIGSGNHSWTPGYFDYHRMGLGDVLSDVGGVGEWISRLLDGECRIEPRYRARLEATFLHRDTLNSSRTVRAVQALLSGEHPHAGLPDLPDLRPSPMGKDAEDLRHLAVETEAGALVRSSAGDVPSIENLSRRRESRNVGAVRAVVGDAED